MKFFQVKDDCVIATSIIEKLYIDMLEDCVLDNKPLYVLKVLLNDYDEINYEISKDIKALRETLKDLCNKLNGAG